MSVSVVFSVDHVNSFHVRDFPFKVWVGGSSIFSEETKQLWGCGHGFSMIGSFGFILVALVFLLWHTFPAEHSSHCRWSGPLPRPAVMSSDNFDFQRIWSECPAASTVQMPWEKPFWKSFFEGSVLPQPREWKASIPPAFVQCALDVEPQPAKKAKTVPPVSWHHVVKSSADVSWQDKREADFQVSLRRWLDLLIGLPSSTTVVWQLEQCSSTTGQLRMLRDILGKKSPATMRKRVNSFLRFVHFLETNAIIFPGSESDFYNFLDGERLAGAPASRSQSVIQALLFAQHVIGIQQLEPLTSSRRCLGISNFHAGGPKRQADPFRLKDLLAFHAVLMDSGQDLWNRLMAGMILLAVYSRSRWSDLQQAESCLLDADDSGVLSYIELRISDHKTKFAAAFKNCFLHACAPALGVTNDPWIEEWVSVRKAIGIDFEKGHPTMPAPQADGKPGTRPLSSEEMKHWTHLLLNDMQIDFSDRRITSHSCKCTLLSWASKRGLPWEDRMILGGHTMAFKSALVYSRDSLGRPLRMLERLLMEVRCQAFVPDASRSGRFPGRRVGFDDFSGFDELEQGTFEDAIDSIGVPDNSSVEKCLEPSATADKESCKVETDSSSWVVLSDNPVVDLVSSSDSDRSSVRTTSSSSDEEGAQHSGARRPVRPPSVPKTLKLVKHRKWKTLHLMEMQN